MMLHSPRLWCFGIATLLLFGSQPSLTQTLIRPQVGLQTMWFNGDYPVRQPISPGVSRDLPLGGGVIGNSNGLHLGVDIIPDAESPLRIPIVAEAFFLNGKTTFAASRITDRETRRWTFTHTAQIYSMGAGIGTSFFTGPTLYMQAEGRVNILPRTDLHSRIYLLETDETISETLLHPDTTMRIRYGAYLKLGTQLPFYDPFLIDISVGYGVINLAGKEANVEDQRNLLVVDNRPAPEVTIGYIGLGFSMIYRY